MEKSEAESPRTPKWQAQSIKKHLDSGSRILILEANYSIKSHLLGCGLLAECCDWKAKYHVGISHQ